MKRFLLQTIAPPLAAAILRVYAATFRIEIVDPEGLLSQQDQEPLLFAFWHNRLLFMGLFYRHFFPKRPGVAMTSRSRDGEIIARILKQFHIDAARGSSSRKGNLAAREIIRRVNEEKCDVAITPDGPRGPCYVVQPGIVQIAQLTGRPIVPVTYHFSRRRDLRSWDRFQVPYPFARCRIVFSPRVFVPPELTAEEMAAICQRIGDTLGE